MRPRIKKGQLCLDTETMHPLLCIEVHKKSKHCTIIGISLIDGSLKDFQISKSQPIIKYTLAEAVLARKRKMITVWKLDRSIK